MKITNLALALSTVLLAPAAVAQNLAANPGFENGLTGWTTFGSNISAEVANPPAIVPHSGNSVCKIFGDFTGSFAVSGLFQALPASAGQTYTLDCWSRHWSGDPMVGVGAPNDNWCIMKIAFFDSANTEVGNAEGTICDGNTAIDIWVDNTPISATAPPGTVRVEAFILYLQPGLAGGAALIDDIEFTGPPQNPAYPGTGEDLVLASAVNGSFASSGPGNDIKAASGGNVLEFRVSSPNGTFDNTGYFLVGLLFPTGIPPAPTPTLPGIWFSSGQYFVMVQGLPTPIGAPLIAPGGTSTFYRAPANFGGLSVMVQALVVNPIVANRLYAASDAHEIRLQ